MHSEKNQHGDFFKNFKSQCSVTKHIIPLIKLTYYTYEWYCLKTLEPQLLEVQSQQGDLCGTHGIIYLYILIYTFMKRIMIYVNMETFTNYLTICAKQILYTSIRDCRLVSQ